jgi:DNA-binding beta-propeller fold protein YncE
MQIVINTQWFSLIVKNKYLQNLHKVTLPIGIIVITSFLLFAPMGGILNTHSEPGSNRKANSKLAIIPNSHRVTEMVGDNPNMVVNPYALETGEPAPMGIADYGVGPGNTAYAYNTSSFLGIAQISSLSTNSSGNNEMAFQLNDVLVFGNGASSYSYWIQDVAFVGSTFDGNTPYIQFIDNVWNFSSSTASMYATSISGNGTVSTSDGTGFYYDCANSNLPGNDVYTNFPINIQLKVVAYMSGINPAVEFQYNDGSGWVAYDNVIFPFATSLTYYDGFVVDGYKYNPYGTFYDAELIMGGPGGGSQTIDKKSVVSLQLEYWNGNNYQQITNAYDFGSDTAEGISNVSSYLFYLINGVYDYVYAGTGGLMALYDSNNIATVNILSGLSSGNLYVNNTFVTSFVGGDVNVTIAPGCYDFQIMYQNGATYYNEDAKVIPGQHLSLNFENLYNVTFIEANLPIGTLWAVTLGGVTNSSTSDVINFREANGNYAYTISGIPGYKANTYSGTVNVPNGTLNIGVIWTQVTYKVSFEEIGLTPGMLWTVTLESSSLSEYSSIITFSDPNGTFAFTVQPVKGYITNPSSGLIQIVDGQVSITPVIVSFQSNKLKNYGYTEKTINLSSASGYSGEYLDLGYPSEEVTASQFEAYDSSNGYVYISTSMGVTVLDSYTDTEVTNIYLGAFGANYIPSGIVYDPVNQYIYVTVIANGGSSQSFYLLSINAATQQVISNLIFLASNDLGELAFDPIFDPGNGLIYVPLNDSIYVVNPSTASIEHVINIGSGSSIYGLALDNFNGLLYGDIYNGNSEKIGNVTSVNPVTYQVFPNITLGDNSVSLTLLFDPANHFLYAGSLYNNVTVINSSSKAVVSRIHFSQSYQLPLSMVYDPLNNFVYVATDNKSIYSFSDIYVINSSTNEVIDSIPSFGVGFGIVFSSASQQLYLTNLNDYTFIISTEHFYEISLNETNLTLGTEWWVNLSTGMSYSSNSTQVDFYLPNGTVSYTLAVALKTWAPNSIYNTITIKGNNTIGKSAPFHKVTFTAKFSEYGLITGTKWYISIDGGTYSSANSTLLVSLQNQTYNYILESIAGFTTSEYTGSFTISGSGINETVIWSQVLYKVTFTETGLPQGTTWSIDFDNTTKSSLSNIIVFDVPNGTFSYIVGTEHGFKLVYGNNVTVNGSSLSQNINFVRIPSNTTYYIIIGSVAGAIVFAGAILFMIRRKR